MVQAKVDFACWQYPTLAGDLATLQFFVMYHGGPGCSGSDMSGPAWK
jgi:carboxypeptidase C (cathepsin A)